MLVSNVQRGKVPPKVEAQLDALPEDNSNLLNNLVTSPSAKKWRKSASNASYFKEYDETVAFLLEEGNMLSKTNSDGYYRTDKASHKRFGKKYAIFYRYAEGELHILAVKKHYGHNKYKIA
ncbi:unnamed protein product [Rotaria magnacalcarata]|uniref:Uncharacterized protein n=1 Tax=Rotaria magnacalcarata TaxID=392030 RepID=A0A816CD53_9BILA|nr:unnamed protein product [Rotaria magnacalcarata]CAF5174478.1 unnamed protein product [Rotaria magnacalcarata]